jgi:predicted TIM-barrel fold metal-dependent hydrolase
MSGRRRIDVHHHILPPRYASWLRALGVDASAGRALPDWSVEETLGLMDSQQIAKAIVSVSTPGVHPDPQKRDDSAGRAMAREVNEFAARLAGAHPERFGFFATLTLPDVEGALAAEGRQPLPELLEDFRSFFFDTAISGTPAALPSLLAFAKPGHVLFGSDFPFLPAPAVAHFTALLDGYAALDAAGHAAIDHHNASALFGKEA